MWHGTNDTTLRYPNFGEADQAVDQRARPEPDADASPTRRSPAGPAPATAAPAPGAGRGDQHRRRRAQPAAERPGRDGDRVLRPRHHRRPARHRRARRRRATPAARRSPPPSSPPPSPPPPVGACRVTYTVNAWNTGLTAAITITNTGTTAVNGWSLVFTLPEWTDHHLRLERHLLADQRAGDRPQHHLQRRPSRRARSTETSASRPPTPATPAGPPSFTLNGSACTIA